MALNLRQVDLFRLVMQTRNLTETARLLRVSQPAVSQSLKELEAQLGLALFVRSGSRISPTGEARMLLPSVERLLMLSSAVESQAAELRDAGAGSLGLAATPGIAGCILPVAARPFCQERPRVRLRLHAHTTQDVVREIRQETADLGFLFGPVDDPAMAVEPLMQARMMCVLPPGHPLELLEEIEPTHLMQDVAILLNPSQVPGILLRDRLRQQSIKLERVIETNLAYAAIGLVREGAGMFVTDPVILLSGLTEGLVVRPFTPDLTVTLAAIFSRHRPVPRLAVRFIRHLRAALAPMCQTLTSLGCEAKAM